MNVRYRVELNQDARAQLNAMLGGGKHAARKLKRAQILLAADAGESDEAIAANVFVGLSTAYRTKRPSVGIRHAHRLLGDPSRCFVNRAGAPNGAPLGSVP